MNKILVIQRPSDGRYLDVGYDCADKWVADPYDASQTLQFDQENYANPYMKEGAIIVEFLVTLTPTGRTCADLYKEQRAEREVELLEEERLRVVAKEEKRLKDEEHTRILATTLGIDRC